MSSFATLYGLSQLMKNELRVGLNFRQFQILDSAFPYFTTNFKEHLMDSWYCNTKPSKFQWKEIGIQYYYTYMYA